MNPAQTPIGYALTAIMLVWLVISVVIVMQARRPPG